jgi:hypothetical protein
LSSRETVCGPRKPIEKGSTETPDLDLPAATAAGEASFKALELNVCNCDLEEGGKREWRGVQRIQQILVQRSQVGLKKNSQLE